MASVPTPAELQYEREHINESQVPSLIASNVVCIGLAFLAVILRFLCRRMGKIKYEYDDWLILAGLVLTTGVVVSQLIGIKYGAGRHTVLMTSATTSNKQYTQTLLTVEVLYNAATFCIKGSILYLYYRVFFVSRRFIYILIGVAVFIFIYTGIQGVGSLIQCIPLNANWNPHVRRKCLVVSAADTVFGIANVATDFIILILPMPLLWRLQTPLAQKLKLMGMFLLGGFVCFASIYRAVIIHNLTKIDPSWTDTPSQIWTAVELGMGVVSVCLPTYRPIFTLLVPKLKSKMASSFGSSGWDSDQTPDLRMPHSNSLRSNSNSREQQQQDIERYGETREVCPVPSRSRPSQSARFAHIGILGRDLGTLAPRNEERVEERAEKSEAAGP